MKEFSQMLFIPNEEETLSYSVKDRLSEAKALLEHENSSLKLLNYNRRGMQLHLVFRSDWKFFFSI